MSGWVSPISRPRCPARSTSPVAGTIAVGGASSVPHAACSLEAARPTAKLIVTKTVTALFVYRDMGSPLLHAERQQHITGRFRDHSVPGSYEQQTAGDRRAGG